MKYNWSIKKLSQIAHINPKEIIGKCIMAKKVPMDKLQPFCRDISEFILEEYKSGAKFRNDDTIMARITPCLENGKISKVSVLDDDEVGFGSTEYIVFRAVEGISDSDFLYYLICSPLVRNPAIKSMVGSSGRQRVQIDVVADLDIELPHIEEQRKMGSILRALDDKIALNKAINNNLEQQAMSLFKYWFIDYKPFSGIIPSDWKKYRLNDFLPVITGKKNANVSSSTGLYPFFSCSQDITWTDEYSFEGNAILVAGNGDFNVKFYNGKFEAYQRTYVLIPHNPRFSAWLFYAIKYNLNKITLAARGSVIKFITKGNLEDFSLYAPINLEDFEIIDHFNSINDIIATNRKENVKLSQLRDILLPKLMSGELDVSNLDI